MRTFTICTVAFIITLQLVAAEKAIQVYAPYQSLFAKQNISKIKYDIQLKPNFTDNFVDGVIKISFVNDEPKKVLTLNAAKMEILSAKLESSEKETNEVQNDLDKKTTLLSLSFKNELQKGEYLLSIEFKSLVTSSFVGFYKASSSNPENVSSNAVIYSTFFQHSGARFVFPCWDSPDAKVNFAITTVVPNDMEAFSNMPEESNSLDKAGLKVVKFKESPLLSPYLITFAIGNFGVYTHPKKIFNTDAPLRVISKNKDSDLKLKVFMAEAAEKALTYLTNITGVPYWLPKLDILAVDNHPAGGMEDAGLYKVALEHLKNINQDNLTHYHEYRLKYVVYHETAHQWFGNLVTAKNWEDGWIQEGLTDWFTTNGLNKIEGNKYQNDIKVEKKNYMDSLKQSISNAFTTSLSSKKYDRTQPTNFEFLGIGANRGWHFFNLIHDDLGENSFHNLVKEFINKFKQSNFKTKDLIDLISIEMRNARPQSEIMDYHKLYFALIYASATPVLKLDSSPENEKEEKLSVSLEFDVKGFTYATALKNIQSNWMRSGGKSINEIDFFVPLSINGKIAWLSKGKAEYLMKDFKNKCPEDINPENRYFVKVMVTENAKKLFKNCSKTILQSPVVEKS